MKENTDHTRNKNRELFHDVDNSIVVTDIDKSPTHEQPKVELTKNDFSFDSNLQTIFKGIYHTE